MSGPPVVRPDAFVSQAGLADPVFVPGLPVSTKPESSRRSAIMQVRPEYTMVALMAQRPGQLRKLFESLGGNAATLDVEVVAEELTSFIGGGGTLAQFGARRNLDPTTLYLLAVQSRLAQRSGKGRVSHAFERDVDDLLAGHEVEISAALNTHQAMRALAGTASDRMWMRSLYVAAITVRSPISESFESLLQRFGTDGFERGAATLLRALSEDIAANRSSVPSDRLQGLLLASLVSMRHVLGLIHSSQGFLRKQGFVPTKPVQGNADPGADPQQRKESNGNGGQGDQGSDSQSRQRAEALTVQLVRLLLQLAATSNATRAVPGFLYQDVGGAGMQSHELVRLRSQFLDLIRTLPTSLWKEAVHKDHLMEALRRQFEMEASQRALPAGVKAPPALQAIAPPQQPPQQGPQQGTQWQQMRERGRS